MDPQAFFGGGGGGPQVGPNQTRMEGAIAAAGGIPQIPGADYSGVDKHLQLQQQALENVQKPFEFTYKPPEYPDRPAPEQLQDVNYASSDAAFAAGAPKNPFGGSPEEQEKQKLKMRRASYWAGLGQAFASFKDGQGLGSLLANAGGAMLSGAMQGDENVRAKMEAFDKSMSQYKLAESSRDQTKATNTANLVNQNIQNNNQHAALKWADEMKEQQKLDVQFTPDGRAMVGEKLPDGQIRYKSTMINPAAVNGILDQIGATHERRSAITNRQQELEYEGELSTFKMLLPAAYADAMQQGDVKTAAEAQMLAAHVAAFEITDGNTWRQVVEALPNGKATAAKMNYDAWQSVGVMADEETGDPVFGQSPTSEQTKGYRNFIQNNLVQTFMETGNIHRLIGGPTREVYTDQPGMPGTGVHSYKAPDSGVTGAIYGNAVRDRQVSRRSTTKLPFGGSESTTVKE